MQGLSCEQLRSAIAQGGALTAAEWAHVEACEACLDAWVCYGLESKPEAKIPVDFAARVAAAVPGKRETARELRQENTEVRSHERQWGLLTAMALVAAGLVAMTFADPMVLNTRIGLVLIGIAASEIAGIALWLGMTHPSEGRN